MSGLNSYHAGRRPGKDLSRLKGKQFRRVKEQKKKVCRCSNTNNVEMKRTDIKVISVNCPKCNEHVCMVFERYYTVADYKH